MPLPVFDLPQDRTGASSADLKLEFAQVTHQIPVAPSLERLAAALTALLFKYTQEGELALGILRSSASANDPRLHLLHVADTGSQSLASLEEAASACCAASPVATEHEAWQGLQVFVSEQSALVDAKPGSRMELRLALGSGGGITWLFRQAMYTKVWVDRAHGHLLHLLAANVQTVLPELSLLSDKDTAKVLHEFNRTTVVGNSAISVLHGVQNAVATCPVRKAVRVGKEAVTYSELWAMAGELGDAIARTAEKAASGAHPTGPGAVGPVAVLLERGLPMIVALLAVWRAGGACMPLDLKTPQQRLEHMLGEAKVRAAVTTAAARERLSWLPCSVINVEDYLATGNTASSTSPAAVVRKDPALEGSSTAYVLFTSGSTGLPKGVLLTHTNLLAYIGWHSVYYNLGPEDRVPHMAGLSFDASMAEIWPTLCSGGCILPAPNDEVRLMPEALCRWYAEAGATVAFLTTQLAEAVLQEPSYPENLKVRTLFTGGDKLHFGPPTHAPFKLVNIYGPTECTVNVTMCLVPTGSGPPPIGEPVVGAQLYVVDPQMRPQPVGVYGELYIGGPQVGAGYLGKPELTAERFIDNPFADVCLPASVEGPTLWPTGPSWQLRAGPRPADRGSSQRLENVSVRSLERCPVQHGAKLYRTGDLVRWMEDGSIDFLGRADLQVKIRGQRIELGEIEARLLQHEAVKECCVICRTVSQTNDKYLAGYWTKDRSAAEASNDELSDWLRAALPEYMVPKVMMELPKLPVNANGKVDRRALPEPELPKAADDKAAGEPQEPANELEGQLSAIFEKVLGRGPVPVTVSFFELGGHSLSVGQLVNKVRRDAEPMGLPASPPPAMPEQDFLLTIGSGGADLHRLVAAELRQLGAAGVERSGQARVFFRAAAEPPERFEALCSPEKLYAIVLRQPTASLDLPPGGEEAEEALAAAIAKAEGWAQALETWRLLAHAGDADAEALPRSFRATGKRAGRLMARLSSNGISALVGEAVAEAKGWEVDLKGFDLEVVVLLNDDVLLVLLPLLERGSARQSHFACAGLTQPVAWAMARSADIAPGEVVLDPMCGSGIILLEAAQCWPEARYLGFDVDTSQLRRSAANVELLSDRAGHAVAFARADVARLPLPGGSVDAVVCDLPFGKLYGSEEENETLYPAALQEFHRVLRPGTGRAVLLTSQANAERLGRAFCAPPAGAWAVTCRRKLLLGNMEAVLFLALALPDAAPGGGEGLPAECLRLPWEDGKGRHGWGTLKAQARQPLQPVLGGRKQLLR